MTDQATTLKALLSYTTQAELLLSRLKAAAQIEKPLIHAYRHGDIPRSGMFAGIHYHLHGGGVILTQGDVTVDLELGRDDFAGAVDAWRLSRYMSSNSAKIDSQTVKDHLESLCAANKVVKYEYLGDEFYRLAL